MTYTLCIHNLIITIRKNVRLRALVEFFSKHFWSNLRMRTSSLLSFDSVSVICLQLSCLFNKRRLGNRYGPF